MEKPLSFEQRLTGPVFGSASKLLPVCGVFPKRLITFNPMQYVVKRVKDDEYELFTEDGTGDLPVETPTISL